MNNERETPDHSRPDNDCEYLQMVDVPLKNGKIAVGLVIRRYANNFCMVAYTDENGAARERMFEVKS